MLELKDNRLHNQRMEHEMAKSGDPGKHHKQTSEEGRETKSRHGKSLNNTQTTVVMTKALFEMIIEEQYASRQLNRNLLLRTLIVEALRVRRKKRGLETPDELVYAE
jgi:hypothetical protein